MSTPGGGLRAAPDPRSCRARCAGPDCYAHLYWPNSHSIVTVLDAVARRRLHKCVRHARLAEVLKRIEASPDLVRVVQVSIFTCGPDLVVAPFVAGIMKRRPILLIQSDAAIRELAHLENRVNTYRKQLELGLHAKLNAADVPPFEIRVLDELRSVGPFDRAARRHLCTDAGR